MSFSDTRLTATTKGYRPGVLGAIANSKPVPPSDRYCACGCGVRLNRFSRLSRTHACEAAANAVANRCPQCHMPSLGGACFLCLHRERQARGKKRSTA